jgi:ABC-type branched-subunit amino acid transport system substrate-binding protein
MTRTARLVAAWSFIALASGCAKPGVPGVSEKEVVLGMSAPLSGPAAAWGSVHLGAQAWATHVNANGGVNGRQIRVVVKDDGYVPGRAVANVTEMKDSVFAIVGLLGTAVLNANKDLVAEAGVPVVGPFGNPRIFARQPKEKVARVFALYPDYESEGNFLGGQIVAQTPARKAAVFYQNDDYGKEGKEGLLRGLGTAGGTVVAEVPYELQDRELGLQALKLKESGAEVVVLFSTTTHGANLVKEMAKVGYRPAVFASFPLGDYQVMYRLLGELWNGAYVTGYVPFMGEPEADRVIDVLLKQDEKLKGRELFALTGAITMMVAVEGLRLAGHELTRESYVRALEGLRDFKPEGLGAGITFGPGRHHGLNTVRLLRTKSASEPPEVLTSYQPFPALF